MALDLIKNAGPEFFKELPQDQLPPSNRKATFYGTGIAFQVVAAVAVAFRIYCRTKLTHSFGWDDVLVIAAAVSTVIGTAYLIKETEYGLGQHFGTIVTDESRLELYLRTYFITNMTYLSSTTFIKLSILLQYTRMYKSDFQRFPRRICFGLFVFIAVWGITFFFTSLFSCTPISGAWHVLGPRKCFGMAATDPNEFYESYLAHSITNMLFDYIVLCFPAFFYRYLQLEERRSKAGIIGLFSMGFCVATISAVRLVFIIKTRAATVPNYDLSFHAPLILLLSTFEIEFAVICASMPVFWPTLIAGLNLRNITVVREVMVRTETRKPAADRGWKRHSDSSDTELRDMSGGYESAAGFAQQEQRVYKKNTYITGWELDARESRGNIVTASRASGIPSIANEGGTWLDLNLKGGARESSL